MKKFIIISLFLLISSITISQVFTSKDYTKTETYITMRDGIKLFTVIYQPKDTTRDYPIFISRTPYGCRPYGKFSMREPVMYNPGLVASGYIFVYQDIRGRWMSEGDFENTRPPYSFWDSTRTDEITDSWDTFEWLNHNLKHSTGDIGIIGNSYLGWTSLVGAVSRHPALKAALAMSPVTSFYFEDFSRYGLFALNYLPVLDAFGLQTKPTEKAWYNFSKKGYVADASKGLMADYYQFFLDRRALGNFGDMVDPANFFWQNIKAHPNYDNYHKMRNWLQYLNKINCKMLIVGGWNDEQNLYGILNSFKKLEKDDPKANVQLVMGPWAHHHPMIRDSLYYLGNVFYGYDLSKKYQNKIEFSYFEYYLKGKGRPLNFKSRMFDTGKKKWVDFNSYPFVEKDTTVYFLGPEQKLDTAAASYEGYVQYLSDLARPVPFVEDDHFKMMAPKHYMTDDQRFAGKRPDVLFYESKPLTKDITVLGEIKATINFATDHRDADIYVKIIDVYPMNRPPQPTDKHGVKMNGYQQLVRVGYIRGRFRESYTNPGAFVPNKKTTVEVPLLEVFHTFKKGHRLMVQVQSSMFPLFDLNPQKYVENIYEAKNEDFEQAWHKVYYTSEIKLPVIVKK